tara:strand:- start:94 stop:723 length:630 start_codon:yes stop_codon:yes gene_type:complete
MMATLDVKYNTMKKYQDCNSTLPKDLPYITKAEAQRAYRLLVRKFGTKQVPGYKGYGSQRDKTWIRRKMSVREIRPLKLINGSYKRFKSYETWTRKCWICLSGNPSTLHNGWRRLIHDVSHMVHRWLRPNMKDHCFQQAELELNMIKYVQFKGWLNGTLKKKVIVHTPEDKKLAKIKHLEALVRKWERKNKTTLTYLKKYKTKLKRLTK